MIDIKIHKQVNSNLKDLIVKMHLFRHQKLTNILIAPSYNQIMCYIRIKLLEIIFQSNFLNKSNFKNQINILISPIHKIKIFLIMN